MRKGASPRRIALFHSPACAVVIAACALGCGQGGASGASSSAGAGDGKAEAPAPPTERWTEVKSEAAPLLITMTEELPPPEIVRRGELLRVGEGRRVSTWKGLIDDVQETRDGMVFGVQRSKDGTMTYAFQSDLGGEVAVSATTWLCAELAKRKDLTLTACASNMRRARAADGAIVSYLACGSGLCPVTVERGGKLGVAGIEGLNNAFFFTGKKKSVLVVGTRFVKDEGKVTGGAVEIVTLDGPEPIRSAKFDGDGVDARDADHVTSKVVQIAVTRAELRLTGNVEVHGPGGKLEQTRPIDEKHPLPPLD